MGKEVIFNWAIIIIRFVNKMLLGFKIAVNNTFTHLKIA